MSARQNKKRGKGRNNANNRERTVTTLTEDPSTPFLVPTPSEEPAGGVSMATSFSVTSPSGGNPSHPSSSAYQPPGSYNTLSYNSNINFGPPMQGHQPQQQPQFYPQQQAPSLLPPGKNDLEILEKLKEMIKSGQHEMYRPVPQPAFLAGIYLGPHSNSQAPLHPDQPSDFHQGNGADLSSQLKLDASSAPSSPVDLGRRPPRMQSKENWGPSGPNKLIGVSTMGGAQTTDNTNQGPQGYYDRYNQSNGLPAIDTSAPGRTNLAGPPSAGAKRMEGILTSNGEARSTLDPSANNIRSRTESASSSADPSRSTIEPAGRDDSVYDNANGPGNKSPVKTTPSDGKDDPRSKENGWSRSGPPVLDDRPRDLDHRPPSPGSRASYNGNYDPRFNDRIPPPRDDRFFNRDRDREFYRDRGDWERNRRFEENRGYHDDVRRPPPEQRHYVPEYYDRPPMPPRRLDSKDESPLGGRRLSDARGPLPPPPAGDRGVARPPSADDRPSAPQPPSDDNRPPVNQTRISPPDVRAPPPDSRAPLDNRPAREMSFKNQQVKPAPEVRRDPAPIGERPSPPVPAARPSEVSSRLADDRPAPRPPGTSAPEVRNAMPTLEERVARPSLQERLAQPPVPVPETRHPNRQPSLEARLSHAPTPTDSRDQHQPPPPTSFNTRPRPVDWSISERDGPPQFGHGPTPAFDPPPRASYPRPPVRSATDPHDTARPVNPPSPPTRRSVSRDFRRPLSRERVDTRANNYRPDERPYEDHRRADAMDVDAKYGSGPYRPFSPPSAADLARDRDRARMTFPPSDERFEDPERRYGGREWPPPSYPQSYDRDRRREWSANDDDYLRSRPPPAQWERPPPPQSVPGEKERYERDVPAPPPRHWEPRDDRERERREGFPRAGSPPPPPGSRASYDPPPRSMGGRVGDGYPPGGGGPPLPPGGGDRERATYPPPPPAASYNRVRPRSISPARRPGGPDDARPPLKRPREDGYGAEPFYPGPGGRSGPPHPPPPSSGARSARPGEYPPPPPPPRGSTPGPPPSSGGSGGFYERGAGPPPSSGGTTNSGSTDRDREYRPLPPGREYPGSYDRPRSPPRGYVRDERRYIPHQGPPPQGMMTRRA